MKLEKIVQEFRDERSMELYGKPECQLQLGEIQRLNEYINDWNNPILKPVIIDGKDTGYKVSNVGIVVNPSNIVCKTYQQNSDWYVSVYIKQTKQNSMIHRLVAQAFIPNPENKPQVNHKNGIKYCNWVGNLEWTTAKENSDHAWNNNLVDNRGEKQGSSINKNKDIELVCKLLSEGKTNTEVSKLTGVKEKTVSDIRCGTRWKWLSSKYNIPAPRVPMYSDEIINQVCKLLEDPTISQSKISSETGVDINTLKDIMKKTRYRRISDLYNIKKRVNSSQYSPISKYNESQIRLVCELIAKGIPFKNINNETGVGISTIYDIARGKSWKLISSNYNLIKSSN